MENFLLQLQNAITQVQKQIPLSLALIGILWLILIINKVIGYRLNWLGIYPRHPAGLVGIVLHPFLHGSFNHLFFNSIPLFVLLTFLLAFGIPIFICATCCIVILSGIFIWLLGRNGIHVGASALIMGYWAYLLVYTYQHPSILTFILAVVCVYYFGSLLFSIFPQEEKVSWEGHLFGLIAGIATTFICPSLVK